MKVYTQAELKKHLRSLRQTYLGEAMKGRLGLKYAECRDCDIRNLTQANRERIRNGLLPAEIRRLVQGGYRPFFWLPSPFHWFDQDSFDVSMEKMFFIARTSLKQLDWNDVERYENLDYLRPFAGNQSLPLLYDFGENALLLDQRDDDFVPMEIIFPDRSDVSNLFSVREACMDGLLLALADSAEYSDFEISQWAMGHLESLFWETWRYHLRIEIERFEAFAFVAPQGDLWCDRYCDVHSACGVMLWKTLPPVFEFDESGMRLLGMGHASYFPSHDLEEKTRRLRKWIKFQRERVYPEFSGDYVTIQGVHRIVDAPMKTRFRLFGSHPQKTLREALLEGMRELDLDQAFFGPFLVTRSEYRREWPRDRKKSSEGE